MGQSCATLEDSVNETIIEEQRMRREFSGEYAVLKEVFYSPKDNSCLAHYLKTYRTYEEDGYTPKTGLDEERIINVFNKGLLSVYTTGMIDENGELIFKELEFEIFKKELTSLKNSDFINKEGVKLSYEFFIKKIETFKIDIEKEQALKQEEQSKLEGLKMSCIQQKESISRQVKASAVRDTSASFEALTYKRELEEIFYSQKAQDCLTVVSFDEELDGLTYEYGKGLYSVRVNDYLEGDALTGCKIGVKWNSTDDVMKKNKPLTELTGNCDSFKEKLRDYKK